MASSGSAFCEWSTENWLIMLSHSQNVLSGGLFVNKALIFNDLCPLIHKLCFWEPFLWMKPNWRRLLTMEYIHCLYWLIVQALNQETTCFPYHYCPLKCLICHELPSDSISLCTPLLLARRFPLLWLVRGLCPSDYAHAGRTMKKAEFHARSSA